MANTFKKIQTITVGSGGASSIEFTSIPQTYTDLKIVYSTRCTADTVNTTFTLNGSTSNFSFRQIYGSGTAVAANSSAVNTSSGPITNASSYTASTFSSGEVYFPNYTSANNKSFSIDGVTENNAALSYQHFIAGLWSNSAAITTIKLAPDSGNFAQYSTATLYGISNANTTTGGSGKATGGNQVYTDGSYWYHVFTSDGNFVPSTAMNVDYLVVAGGGSGGNNLGGGGGAGGLRCTVTNTGGGGSLESALAVTAQTYAITVGGGAAAPASGNYQGNDGSNSVFSTITSTGGGGGGNRNTSNGNGRSPSGGGGYGTSGTGAGGTANQSYGGGNAYISGGKYGAGGGGGAGAAGSNGTSTAGGNGGNGVATSISGTSTTYGGGGGGGVDTAGTQASGGSGGGGTGGVAGGASQTSGTANTGGGGGGSGNTGSGGAGGSGIVIVRYAA